MNHQTPLGPPYYGQEDPYGGWGGHEPQPAAPQPQRRARRTRPRPKQSRVVSYLLALTVVLGLLIAAITGFLVFALPTSIVRSYIVAEVKAQTGRDLLVEGPSSFTLVPSVNVVLNNVTLLSPPGTGPVPTVTMASLTVRVRTLPLLSRRVVIDRLVLRDPVLDLRTDKSGRRSWQIAADALPDNPSPEGQESAPRPPALRRPQEAGAPSPEGAGFFRDFGAAKLARLDQLELGRLFIKNGTLRYRDERTGTHTEISDINARIGMTSLLSPIHLAGSVSWGGEKLSLRASLVSVRDLLEARPAELTFSLSGKPGSATYEGTVALKDGFALEGMLEADAPSSTDVAAWLGRRLPPTSGGPVSVSGQVKAGHSVVELSEATVGFDGATATGKLSVDTTGQRPYVKADLRISELDLDRLFAGSNERGTPRDDAGAATARPPVLPKSIEELIRDQGTRVKGFKKTAGWSEKPFSLARFDLLDADATLSVGRLRIRDLEVGQSVLKVGLRDKVLKAEFADAPFYNGRASGSITVDARDPSTGGIATDLAAEGFETRALLTDAADVDWLAGTGKLRVSVAGSGKSERQIVESLAGQGSFQISSGAFYGWSLTEILEGLRQGQFSALDRSPSAKTDFAELGGSFSIADGVASNKDLRLTSPQLQAAGAGKVHLGERRLDYVLTPKLVITTGSQKNVAAIEVPVRVDGDWDNPRVAPDLPGALGDPDKTREALREIRKKYKGKSAGEIVKDLFGESEDGKIKIKPKQLLQEFTKPNGARQ